MMIPPLPMPLPIRLLGRRVGGYIAPCCPHCGKELPGWEPPRKSVFDNIFVFVAFVIATAFFAVAFLFWFLGTIFTWAESDKNLTLVDVLRGSGIGSQIWFTGFTRMTATFDPVAHN